MKSEIDSAPPEVQADPAAVFRANLHAVNLMQQRVFCNRTQAIEDPGEQKRLLECSQSITDLINEMIG